MQLILPNAKFVIGSVFVVFLIIATPPYILRKLHSVDGGYTEWTSWGSCLKTCGDSLQGRTRSCSNPRPSGFGKDCMVLGNHIETRLCKEIDCPIDGGLGPWTDWGECDKTCNDGNRKRTRKCDNPTPAFRGKKCDEPLEETQQCIHLKPCPVDGGFSDWGEYGTCSVSCGTGHKLRTRECNKPPPQFGGRNCEGVLQEVVECKEKECEVKTELPK